MGKPIRVLETIRQGQIGGGESHLLDLVDNLDKSEFEPVVLSFTDGPMIDRLKQMGIPAHVIPTTKPFNFTKWRAVRAFIQQQRVQLVHAHGTRAASNVFWAAGNLNLPLIYTVHGWSFHDDQPPLIKKIRVMGEQVLTRKSDVTISVSASNQRTGQQQFSGFESLVINNGINTERFNPAHPFSDLRAELGISPTAVLLVFVARFTHQKQPLALLDAFAEVAKQRPDVHLLMVGDGEQKAEAVAKLNTLACKNQITLVPFRNDVPAVLAAADIYVLPSLWEGLSIALLEAMSMGKAIIATQTDGTIELITHQQNGLLVNINNLKTNLMEAIIQLSTDAPARKKMGDAARQTVMAGFNAATMTRQVEAVYRQLITN
jgi:glycosyltransferase involved in cell wall biosynthesis